MDLHILFADKDEFGYARMLSLVDADETTLWSRTPPTGSQDVWTRAELERERVIAWTWSGHAVTFDLAGKVVRNVFTK